MPLLPGLIANSGGSQPTPPINLFISAVTTSSFTLDWTTPTFLGKLTPLRYVISIYDSSGSLTNASYKTVNYPANSALIDGLAEGTTYSFRMRLENSSGIFSDLSTSSGNVTTSVTPPPTSGTTWYCSQNAEGNGASSFTSTIDQSQSVCDSYAIVCSTSGYPATPSIPACPTTPTGPAPTCANSCGAYGAYGSCQNGTQYSTRTCSITGCTTTRSKCCATASCGAWGPWVTVAADGQQRSRTCTRSDCTTYTDYETRCLAYTRTVCGSCRPIRGIPYKDCTTTTFTAACTQSQSTSIVRC